MTVTGGRSGPAEEDPVVEIERPSTAPDPTAAHPGTDGPAARRPRSRWTVLLATAVVAGPALLLRLWALDAVGLNSDEAVYAGQGASLAHDPVFVPFFPVFRAHPLLVQSLLSVVYRAFGVSGFAGRLLSVALGMATVWVTYAIGARLYGRRVGFLAALLIGVMPYLVIVNRQILLDGPMTFFSAVALYLLVRFVQSKRAIWLYAAAGALGLAVLSKETAILLVGSAYVFFALTRAIRPRFLQTVLATAVLLVTVLPYPLSVRLAGKASTGGSFLIWQLSRRANHSLWFYPETVPAALGFGVLAVIAVGIPMMRRSLSWSEHLLLAWVVVPCVFFELWAVKGFQYLMPIAVPVAVLAAMVVVSVPLPEVRWGTRAVAVTTTGLRVLVAIALAVSLAAVSWQRIQPAASGASYLAGTGGVPGGREAGEWVGQNAPAGAALLAVGPSMANILEFYGHRTALGLSVSPNPLHRNPVYDPVINPDRQIRQGYLQYLVWDSYSASRSRFFAEQLLTLEKRYHGQIVHQEFTTVHTRAGDVRKPVIIVYQVRP